MKKTLVLTSILFFFAALAIQTASAQKISLPTPTFKKDMTGVLSPENDLNLDSSKKEELKSANNQFLDQVLKIAGSNESDDKKRKSLLDLGKKQSGVFSSILGENTAKQYKKNIKKKIRPFKTKYKLATLIL
ncbi:hypothetical protein JYB64_19995 [Algoriphagus aestuarii]|nr:hypothetical protein [Algoriphagus aestuarii]